MNQNNVSPARYAMQRLCVLLGLILAVLFCVTAYVQILMQQNHYTHINQITSLKWSSSEIQSTPEPDSGVPAASQETAQIGGPSSGLINILLVGQDRREGEDRARSDSIILCTYHKEDKKLTITSFLRDLYVPIPGHEDNRINAAYSLGGISLLEQTLEETFGLYIDGSVEVDFSQFSEITDLLGGVEIILRQDEADYINQETGSALTEGRQTLNGQQSLVYSRIRSLDGDGDFSRTNRQRKVLFAMMDVLQTAGLGKLLRLMDELLPMVTTNLNSGKLLGLVLELLPGLSQLEITSQHVPGENMYTDQTIRGMAVLVPDTDAIREMLAETLLGDR